MEFVSYRRVSTGAQAIDGQSLAAQDQRIEAWAAAHHHTCLGSFEDAGISGATITARAGIQAAVKLACKHKAALVVCSLSRLARSTRDALAIGDQLSRAGASLISLGESVDTASPTGRLLWTLLAAVAQWERETIADRTTQTMGFMRSKRLRISGKLPWGWALAGEGEAMVPVPAEQAVLARMLAWRKEGVGFAEMAKRLTAEGVPTKSCGATWTAKTVRRIVARESMLAVTAA
ncbi:MAG: recombinase family protein [Planctomycetes bacterium]|nr:recombinase family protein [Planctomycetota bacterium]